MATQRSHDTITCRACEGASQVSAATRSPQDRALRTGVPRRTGQVCTGLTVITGIGSRGPAGFTVQGFLSGSLRPPMVLVSASNSSRACPQTERSGAPASTSSRLTSPSWLGPGKRPRPELPGTASSKAAVAGRCTRPPVRYLRDARALPRRACGRADTGPTPRYRRAARVLSPVVRRTGTPTRPHATLPTAVRSYPLPRAFRSRLTPASQIVTLLTLGGCATGPLGTGPRSPHRTSGKKEVPP